MDTQHARTVLRSMWKDTLHCLDAFFEEHELPEGEVWELAQRLKFVYESHLHRLDPQAKPPAPAERAAHPAISYLYDLLERQGGARRKKDP